MRASWLRWCSSGSWNMLDSFWVGNLTEAATSRFKSLPLWASNQRMQLRCKEIYMCERFRKKMFSYKCYSHKSSAIWVHTSKRSSCSNRQGMFQQTSGTENSNKDRICTRCYEMLAVVRKAADISRRHERCSTRTLEKLFLLGFWLIPKRWHSTNKCHFSTMTSVAKCSWRRRTEKRR